MIDGDVEKAGDLLGVEIHAEDAADAGGGEQIGDQLGGDRHPRLILAILPGVAKEGNDRRDPRRARPAGCIHHDEQLHQVLIGRRAGRLDDVNIPAADIFIDLDVGLAIGERAYGGIPKRHTNARADPLREVAVRGAGENLHVAWRGGASREKWRGDCRSRILKDKRKMKFRRVGVLRGANGGDTGNTKAVRRATRGPPGGNPAQIFPTSGARCGCEH